MKRLIEYLSNEGIAGRTFVPKEGGKPYEVVGVKSTRGNYTMLELSDGTLRNLGKSLGDRVLSGGKVIGERI